MSEVAVILTDPEQHILWVNRGFEEMTGYRLEEVIGRIPGQVLQGPDTEPDTVAYIRQALKGRQPFRAQLTNYRKNGEAYPCKLVVHPIFGRDDRLINFLAFEVDGNLVTDNRKLSCMSLNPRYRTSSLRGYEEVRLFERARQLMEEDMIYLDPNLSLAQFAERLETNTKYLSQVINHHGGTNFLTFVNTYRVAAVQRELLTTDFSKRTYLSVGQSCGFKNKSTFFKVFRDQTGTTPKAYADAHAGRS